MAMVLVGCGKKGKIYVLHADIDGKDAVLNYPNITNNYGSEKELNIYCDSLDGLKRINRVVIGFNFKSLPEDIEIDSLFLQLYFNDVSGLYKIKGKGHTGNTGLIVENIVEQWEEDVITWAKYPRVEDNKLYYETDKDIHRDYRINLTELLVDEAGNLKHTHGVLLRLQEEENGNYIHFNSREHHNNNNLPKLKVYAKK